LAWIEIHQSLPTHKKTLLASDALGITPVHLMGHMVAFWLWALDNVPDGDLDNISPRVIARAAQWEGDPEQFVGALISVGFIDETGNGLAIHDWYDYAGRLIERRIAERERSRQRRAAAQKGNTKTTAGRPPVDHATTVGTVQYPTVPNSTDKEYICATEAHNDSDENDEEQQERQSNIDKDKKQPRKPFRSIKQQDRFDTFWEEYPRKRSKGQAEKTWIKLDPDDATFECILEGLDNAKRSIDWQKDGGQYIPYPSTWLNAKGWEDEYEEGPLNGANSRHLDEDDERSTGGKKKDPLAGFVRAEDLDFYKPK